MMQRAVAVGGDGIDGIRIETADLPVAGPGEALVRLTAATLNYRDLLFARGSLSGLTKEPDYVPLSCGAGEVVGVGADVHRVAAGDRVSPIFALGWVDGPSPTMEMLGGSVDGTARRYAAFPAESLVRIPDTLGDLDAATLPCAGLTAWNALFQHRPIRAGEWVLTQGTGGVSIAALQFAKAAGAKVAITSSSDAKLARGPPRGGGARRHHPPAPAGGAGGGRGGGGGRRGGGGGGG
ncbi:MAG: NAD(P)-dependent alcohol dehydrogenase, partial [Sphingomonas sp.]